MDIADVEKQLDASAEQVAAAIVELMHAAREHPDEPLDAVRLQVAQQIKTAMRPMLDQLSGLDAALDQAADAVLEVAANMLDQIEALSGRRAARMLRELKSDQTANGFVKSI